MHLTVSKASAITRVTLILLVAFIFFACTYVYRAQIVYWNGGYLGIELFDWPELHLIVLFIALAAMSFLFPIAIVRPTDIFVSAYLLFSCMPFAMFALSRYEMSLVIYSQFLIVLLTPIIFLKLFLKIKMPIIIGFNRRHDRHLNLGRGLLTFSVLLAMVTVYFAPSSASFDFVDVYTRRLDARLATPDGSLLAYANTMGTGAVLPMAAAIYGLNRKVSGLIVCFLINAAFFYVDGSKSTLIISVLAYVLGFIASFERKIYVASYLFWLVGIMFLIFIIEDRIDQQSLAGQYFFRRFFIVPGVVVSAYIEGFFDSSGIWSPLAGMRLSESVNYYVGDTIFGHKGDNSGTSAFVSALASAGLFGYIFSTVAVVLFYRVLDMLSWQTGDQCFLFLGFIYVMKLVEQNAFTALGSSGIGAIFLILLISNYKHKTIPAGDLSGKNQKGEN